MFHVKEVLLTGSYRGISAMVHKGKKLRITDIKISFSWIMKISKQDNLLDNMFLHKKECLKKANSWIACERRRISGCHWFRRKSPGDNWQPEIRLRLQANSWSAKSRFHIANDMPKSLSIDDSNLYSDHSEDSRLKITENRVMRSRIIGNNLSCSRVTQSLQITRHEE